MLHDKDSTRPDWTAETTARSSGLELLRGLFEGHRAFVHCVDAPAEDRAESRLAMVDIAERIARVESLNNPLVQLGPDGMLHPVPAAKQWRPVSEPAPVGVPLWLWHEDGDEPHPAKRMPTTDWTGMGFTHWMLREPAPAPPVTP